MSFLPIGHWAMDAAGRLTVRSALNPLLWMCGIVAVPCFIIGAVLHEDRIAMGILFAMGFPAVLTAIVIAIKFAWHSPEKLQSEDYQLRHQSLQMLQGREGAQRVIDAVVAIANPAVPLSLPEAPHAAPAAEAPAPDDPEVPPAPPEVAGQ